MANIKLNLPGEPFTKQIVTFTAPCDCASVTDGLVINGETYTVCDAMGECVTGKGGAWCAGAQISVVLDCENKKAFIQNAAAPESLRAHIENQNNPHNVTADQVAVTENVVKAIRETGNWSVDSVLSQIGSLLYGGETLYRWEKVSPTQMTYTHHDKLLVYNGANAPGLQASWYAATEISISDDGMITFVNPSSFGGSLRGVQYDAPAKFAQGCYIRGDQQKTTRQAYYGKNAYLGFEPYYNPDGSIGASEYYAYLYNVDVVTSTGRTRELVTSTDPNAHYDGEVDAEGYTYTALEPITAFVPRIATGSYKGTGTYGKSNPCSVALGFEPKVFIARPTGATGGNTYIWIVGMTNMCAIATSGSSPVTVNENGISWYNTSGAQEQLNNTNAGYNWFALG